jgi:hypothetical protein
MRTVFIINGHDYTRYILELKPTQNDIDSKYSGRNLLDGEMYRKRVASKEKWSVSFDRLSEAVMSQLLQDMDSDFVRITMLDAKQNRHIQRTYYCSTINKGVQHSIGEVTVYDGVTFNIIER